MSPSLLWTTFQAPEATSATCQASHRYLLTEARWVLHVCGLLLFAGQRVRDSFYLKADRLIFHLLAHSLNNPQQLQLGQTESRSPERNLGLPVGNRVHINRKLESETGLKTKQSDVGCRFLNCRAKNTCPSVQ